MPTVFQGWGGAQSQASSSPEPGLPAPAFLMLPKVPPDPAFLHLPASFPSTKFTISNHNVFLEVPTHYSHDAQRDDGYLRNKRESIPVRRAMVICQDTIFLNVKTTTAHLCRFQGVAKKRVTTAGAESVPAVSFGIRMS